MTRPLRWALLAGLMVSGAVAAPGEWVEPPARADPATLAFGGNLEDEAERLQRRLDAVKRELREREAMTIARGRAYVRLARAGLLPLADGLDALADHAARLERLRRAVGRDLERQRQLNEQRLEVARSLQTLDNLRPADRQAVDRARSAIAAAEEREAAFRRAFHSDWQPEGRTAVYAARVAPGATSLDGGGFQGRHGRLPFPVAGRAEIESVRSPSGQGKALIMTTVAGAKVRAVHPGRVAFADEYPDLGKTVIIDHGGQHYSVSAHLGRLFAQAGDEVATGQAVGSVGTYRQRPALLFEVRSGQTTLDTPKWFGL